MTKGFLIAGTNRHFLEDRSTVVPLYTIVVNYGMSVSSKQIKSHVFFQPKTAIFGWDS